MVDCPLHGRVWCSCRWMTDQRAEDERERDRVEGEAFTQVLDEAIPRLAESAELEPEDFERTGPLRVAVVGGRCGRCGNDVAIVTTAVHPAGFDAEWFAAEDDVGHCVECDARHTVRVDGTDASLADSWDEDQTVPSFEASAPLLDYWELEAGCGIPDPGHYDPKDEHEAEAQRLVAVAFRTQSEALDAAEAYLRRLDPRAHRPSMTLPPTCELIGCHCYNYGSDRTRPDLRHRGCLVTGAHIDWRTVEGAEGELHRGDDQVSMGWPIEWRAFKRWSEEEATTVDGQVYARTVEREEPLTDAWSRQGRHGELYAGAHWFIRRSRIRWAPAKSTVHAAEPRRVSEVDPGASIRRARPARPPNLKTARLDYERVLDGRHKARGWFDSWADRLLRWAERARTVDLPETEYEIVRAGLDKMGLLAPLVDAHTIDVSIRRGGKDEHYQADWLKDLARGIRRTSG